MGQLLDLRGLAGGGGPGCPCCGKVLTCCCPASISRTLHATLTGCFAGTYPIVWNGSSWVYGPDGSGLTIGVFCTSVCQWVLDIQCPVSIHYYLTRVALTVNCGPPLALTWGASNNPGSPPGCCAGTINTVTVGP